MRFRHVYMGLGSLLVVLLWILTDPNSGLIQNLPFGASTLATLVILLKAVLYVAILHLSRRAIIDYIDLSEVFEKAMETTDGASRALIAIGLFMVALAIVIFAATVA